MTTQQLAQLLAFAKLAASIEANSPELQALKAASEQFAQIATTALPAKDDGTPYTDDDLAALEAGNHAKALEILGRHGVTETAPVTGNDPGDETK